MSKRPSRGVSSGVGSPTKMTGRDGDLTIRKTREGKILYVKEHGSWHPINTGVDTIKLKKDVDRLIRSVNTLRSDSNPFPTINSLNVRKDKIKLGTDGTGITLKNNSGALQLRNEADSGDVVLATTYTAAKCTDPLADQTTAALKGVNAGTELTSLDMANDIIYISDANDSGDIKHSTAKVLTSAMAGSGLTSSAGVMAVSGIDTTHIAADTLVAESEGIGSNDNDTTIPTSAAVKAYADSVGGGFSGSITTNQIAHGSGTNALQGTDNFQFTNGLLSMETTDASSQKPRITFLNSNANDESGTIYFNNTSASPAINDKLMQIYCQGMNNAASPEVITYATIKANILSFSDGSEASYMDFKTMASGSERTLLSLYGDAMLVSGTDGSIAFKIKSSTDAGDFFGVTVDAHGASTIATVDDDATAANLTLDIDGDIELNADGGDITFKDDSAALALINSDGLRIYNTGSSHSTLNTTNTAGDFTLATTGVIVSTTVTNEFTLKNGTGGTDQYALFGNGSEGIRISSKGTQDIRIETNSGTDSGFISIVDGEDGLMTIQPDGEGILLLGATAGSIQFATNTFLDSNGNSLFRASSAGSAVNDVTFGNAATGDSPTIKATGTDTDVDLTLQPKGKGKIVVDKNVSGDAADTGAGLHIDYDRTVASSGTANHNDTGIDVDVSSASLGTGYFRGIDIDVAGTSAGSSTTIGADITVTGADSNIGLLINTPDTHIHMQASADAVNDYGTIAVADTGDMTIATTGNGTKDSDITLDADGSIILDASSGNFVAKRNGTEFSATNSAYAGMILGYTRLEGDLSNQDTFEIQNSLTVEDDEHKITFITPPSQYVEIEATFLINAVSSDTRIFVGLSSANATDGYSAVSAELEYDGTGIVFTDDEVDDHVKTVKWVLKSSHLAGVGSSNTFWIGFSTANATKTAYLGYGYRATHGITDHPFIIKATALPAAIHDGQ
tara:strand:+ start:211 stop:3102 length:2892 start_codon:yes stop_codon:yes gene_type:complete